MLTYVYLALVLICGGFTFITFVLGGIADIADSVGDSIQGAFDSIGDAVGGLFGGPGDGDVGGIDGADADAGGTDSPSPFSLRTILMFLTGFGGGGLIGKGAGLADAPSIIPATLMGLATGAVMYFFMRLLYRGQGSTMAQTSDYIGLIGRVTVPVPAGGRGTVSLTVKGQTANTTCVSADGSAIPYGSEVYVVSYHGGVALVRRFTG